jgi:hypothetical protein
MQSPVGTLPPTPSEGALTTTLPSAVEATPTVLPTPELPTPTPPQVVAPQPTQPLPPTFTPPPPPPTFTPPPPPPAITPTVAGALTSPLPPPVPGQATLPPTQAAPGQPPPAITPTTPIVTSTQPLAPGSQLFAGTVQVISVFAAGNPALNEGDEYVELRNVGQTPAYLDGWKLRAVRNADNVQLDEYIFPGGSVIAANQTCRIYTNLPFGAENCGFAGGFGNDQPLWPPAGARAVLVNPQGQEMSRFVY